MLLFLLLVVSSTFHVLSAGGLCVVLHFDYHPSSLQKNR